MLTRKARGLQSRDTRRVRTCLTLRKGKSEENTEMMKVERLSCKIPMVKISCMPYLLLIGHRGSALLRARTLRGGILFTHMPRDPPLHTDFTHRLHLNKSHHQTSAASSHLPFTYSILIFHFCFILLFHILNLEPESSSEQTSVGFHWTPTQITYSYIYCRITCRYSVRISTWF